MVEEWVEGRRQSDLGKMAEWSRKDGRAVSKRWWSGDGKENADGSDGDKEENDGDGEENVDKVMGKNERSCVFYFFK